MGGSGEPARALGHEQALAAVAAELALDRLPSVVLIEGEAGIGKTMVLREALRLAGDAGYLILTAAPYRDEKSLATRAWRSCCDRSFPTAWRHSQISSARHWRSSCVSADPVSGHQTGSPWPSPSKR